MLNPRQRGTFVEQRAAEYLTKRGLALVERNFRCKVGEIDLVMRDHEHLVFVEVRYRKRIEYGDPLASVDARKQRRLILTAQHYLKRNGIDMPCRFDVLGITGSGQLEWIKDAFGLT